MSFLTNAFTLVANACAVAALAAVVIVARVTGRERGSGDAAVSPARP
jgi:hypothetical protein